MGPCPELPPLTEPTPENILATVAEYGEMYSDCSVNKDGLSEYLKDERRD